MSSKFNYIGFIFVFCCLLFFITKSKLECDNYNKKHLIKYIDSIPYQSESSQKPFLFKSQKITPLADFCLKAMVLSKKIYKSDIFSFISPIDIVFGWQEMSNQNNLKHVEINQRYRHYFYKSLKNNVIPKGIITCCSANIHLIPETEDLKDKLLELEISDIVTLKGFLVKVEGKVLMKSSLTRFDIGSGACEVFFVKKIIHDPKTTFGSE